MSESRTVELGNTPAYSASSVPCKIRFTGRHDAIPDHFHKQDTDKHVVTYLRGRKLHGQELDLKGLTGCLLHNEFDEVKCLGVLKDTVWFEREGHEVETNEKINEGLALSELIHGETKTDI
jgi:hypothetical protein